MKVAIIRGTYFTKFEMANYEPLLKKHRLVGFSGLRPLDKKQKLPLVKLASPVDLPNFPYKMPILNRLFFGDAMYLFGLEKRLKGFDIAHVRETYFHFTQQALKAKEKGWVKKVVCTCSETIPFNHEGIWNRKKFKALSRREVDLFHCHTKLAKDCLIKEGCDPKKIVVFPYGVDIKMFKGLKVKRLKDKQLIINILFVGRLVPEKGIDDLLRAFNKLIKEKKQLQLTIIGKGRKKRNLENFILRKGLKKLVKIKKVPYDKMALEYQQADIFCLLSWPTKHWQEYSSRALTEAMASGLAIIATDNGGTSELMGKAGILVKPKKWREVYQGLKMLIEKKSLREKLAFLARERAEKYFDISKTSQKIEELWQKALD